jgi:hypothetical protein
MIESEKPVPQPGTRWRLHLAAPPARVFDMLDRAEGRERFWARSAPEHDGAIEFTFHGGERLRAPIEQRQRPGLYAVRYFAGSLAIFELHDDGVSGTELTFTEAEAPESVIRENRPGWVSVLLALKAAVDFGVDLRNRDPGRNWEGDYVDV